MHYGPLAFATGLAATGLPSAALAEPPESDCNEAAAFVAEMLAPKTDAIVGGTGWVLYPPSVDYYALDVAEQWGQVATRLSNYPVLFLSGTDIHPPLTLNGTWSDGVTPDEKHDYAIGFTELDTLEQCLRPSVLAAYPEMKKDIADFDSQFPLKERTALRPLMKASQ
jgi:hypothetical protein